MDVNLWAVLAATVAQFIVGAVWYMLLFPKQWGKIHGFEKLSKKQQKDMESQMAPTYIAQLLVTALSAFVLAYFMTKMPESSPYALAFWLWLGFVLPTQVSAVLFGGTDSRWFAQKIAIMASGTLACLMAAAAVLQWLM